MIQVTADSGARSRLDKRGGAAWHVENQLRHCVVIGTIFLRCQFSVFNRQLPAVRRQRNGVDDADSEGLRARPVLSPGQPSLERSKSAAQERETSRSMMSRAEAIQQPDSRGSRGAGIGRIRRHKNQWKSNL